MANLKALAAICETHGKLLWYDACRIYENALMIKLFKKGYADKSLMEIVHEMCALADVVTISFKKMFSHLGGCVLVNRSSERFTKE